ncbi:MAG: transketolase C-terminal domain-containing protein [Patescibacteria group bacterium]
MRSRPRKEDLIGKKPSEVPLSLQRILRSNEPGETRWIGPHDAKPLSSNEQKAYELAHAIMCHLAVRAPTAHQSGHPGGPLSSFTFAYLLSRRRNPEIDQPLRYSAGHLSLLAYGLQWLFGREGRDKRLASPQSIIETFRIPDGLPGHVEAGIGDIPFGTGPLGKGVSNALGAAFGLKYQKKAGIVDVLLADGDCQEGQVQEAFRLASHLKLDHLVVHGDFNDIQLSDMPSNVVAADFASIAAATGWQVIEVQNGNDPAQVSAALRIADDYIGKGKPIFLCYYTTMGHGVKLMEEGSNTGKQNFHGTPLSKEMAEKALKSLPDFNKIIAEYEPFRAQEKKRYASGAPVRTDLEIPWKPADLARAGYERTITSEKGAARKDLGATHLKNLMAADPRIAILHADLAASGGFDAVQKVFPDRVINVGVAEANMVMMAAGMRQTGLLPVTYTFAAFGTNEARANARLIDINTGHTRSAVIHDCTHVGLSVGEDGETHQEQNYLNIPFHHTQVWMLADSNQAAAAAERAMELSAEGRTSVYIFSPRSGHPQLLSLSGEPIYGKHYVFDGTADLIRGQGTTKDVATIIATGAAVHDAILAADKLLKTEKLSVRVLNVACVRPLDASAIAQAALETGHLIVVEDHNTEGGLASQVADLIADLQLPCSLRRLGLTHYFPSGTDKDLKFLAGLDHESILNAVQEEIRAEVKGGEDAFVTTIFSLADNARKSRFHTLVESFISNLISENGYMETLREKWAKRDVSAEKFPGNEQLRSRLKHL